MVADEITHSGYHQVVESEAFFLTYGFRGESVRILSL